MANFGRPSHDQMEVTWSLVSSFLQFSITCFWKLLGSRRYASSSSCVLLTGSKLASFCHFSASLVTCVAFLRALATAIERTEEQCSFCIENSNFQHGGLRVFFFSPKDAVSLNASGDKCKESQNF